MCQTCSVIWNRDVNASLNIYEIIKSTLLEGIRPDYLKRSKDIYQ
jgi:transposase